MPTSNRPTPGGSEIPGGSATQLQYNAGSSFGGITGSSVSGADLVLGGNLTLGDGAVFKLGPNAATVADADIGPGTSSSTDDAARLVIHAGNTTDAMGSASGGALHLRGGNSATATGGDVLIIGGEGVDANNMGSINLLVNGETAGWTVRETTGSFGPAFAGLDFIPSTDNSSDIGSTTKQWAVAYLGTALELGNAAVIRGDATDAHTYKASVYDVNGAAYVDWLTVTNGNTPSVVIAAPAGGTTISIQANTYKSSDGTSGVTAGPFTTITAIQVKNGLVTTLTGS